MEITGGDKGSKMGDNGTKMLRGIGRRKDFCWRNFDYFCHSNPLDFIIPLRIHSGRLRNCVCGCVGLYA